MTTMPDYSMAVTFDGPLSEEAETTLLDRLTTGTVIRHTDDGGTVVAVPMTEADILEAAFALPRKAALVVAYAGREPASLELSPLTD